MEIEDGRVPIRDLLDAEVLLIGDGYRAKNEELSRAGLPFARAQNIDGGFKFDDADRFPETALARVGNKISQAGDVVFTSKGTVGRFAFVRGDTPKFVYSPQLCFWRSLKHDRIVPRWLFYWMQGREFYEQYKGVAGQTDMAEYVSLRDQRAMSISIPEPAKQRAIAYILGTLDDKIELNRRMNETLEELARAIFKSWFVDFDPVRVKANGEPSESICRRLGLTPELLAMFPDRFQESELGEIPEGWKVGTILKHAKLLSGGTPKTDRKEYWDGDILWASAKDVSQCSQTFLIETERSITQRGLEESSTQLIPAFSTVVVARGATTGRMVMLGRDMAMNQTCYALMTTTDTPFALYCSLRHEIDDLVYAAHGSVFDTITTDSFAASRVLLAPERLVKGFEVIVIPFFKQILISTEESRTLSSLRDLLLPKLVSGEVPVPIGVT